MNIINSIMSYLKFLRMILISMSGGIEMHWIWFWDYIHLYWWVLFKDIYCLLLVVKDSQINTRWIHIIQDFIMEWSSLLVRCCIMYFCGPIDGIFLRIMTSFRPLYFLLWEWVGDIEYLQFLPLYQSLFLQFYSRIS